MNSHWHHQVGTVRYQAPETTVLMINCESHTVPDTALEVVHHTRVDVYAYGLVLYEITHGRIAFEQTLTVVGRM